MYGKKQNRSSLLKQISELRSENKRLREALNEIAEIVSEEVDIEPEGQGGNALEYSGKGEEEEDDEDWD